MGCNAGRVLSSTAKDRQDALKTAGEQARASLVFGSAAILHSNAYRLSVQDRTLLWVNIMLALLEDVPMLSLTFAYVLRQGAQAEKPVFIVSMMMSAGAIYLKFGGLIYFPLLADQKKLLENRIASKAANWLSAEDRNALEQHGIRIKCAKADNSTGGVLN